MSANGETRSPLKKMCIYNVKCVYTQRKYLKTSLKIFDYINNFCYCELPFNCSMRIKTMSYKIDDLTKQLDQKIYGDSKQQRKPTFTGAQSSSPLRFSAQGLPLPDQSAFSSDEIQYTPEQIELNELYVRIEAEKRAKSRN